MMGWSWIHIIPLFGVLAQESSTRLIMFRPIRPTRNEISAKNVDTLIYIVEPSERLSFHYEMRCGCSDGDSLGTGQTRGNDC